jgi:hypothetical protein
MKDYKPFLRICLNPVEVKAIIDVLDKVKPNDISNFFGERQALSTFRAKLTKVYRKITAGDLEKYRL